VQGGEARETAVGVKPLLGKGFTRRPHPLAQSAGLLKPLCLRKGGKGDCCLHSSPSPSTERGARGEVISRYPEFADMPSYCFLLILLAFTPSPHLPLSPTAKRWGREGGEDLQLQQNELETVEALLEEG